MTWLLILLQTMTVPATPGLDLASLEAQTLTRHPAIRRAEADVAAARQRAAQMGAWPNPVIGGSTEELRPRESPSGFFGGFVQQTIPLGGKLAASRALGNRDVTVAEAALTAARQQVVAGVRERYYAVVVAEERVAVMTHLSALATESAGIAKQLLNIGVADQPDVLTSEAEAAVAGAELEAAGTARRAAWQQLAAAAADAALTPQPLASHISDALPVFDRETMLAQVLADNGALREAADRAASARAAIDIEKRATRPDLFLRADAGTTREYSGGRPIGPQYGVEAGLSIPLFNRNRAGIASATSRALGADAVVDEARLDLTARFADVFARYDSARTLAETYRGTVLPRVERAYDLQLAKYREMAAAYPTVLQAQRTLFEMTAQYLDAMDRAWMAASALRSALAVR